MTDTIVAYVLLNPPSHDVSNDARSQLAMMVDSILQELGLTVLNINNDRIIISASKSEFEQTFHTKLELRQKEILKIGEVSVDYYAAVTPTLIPERLSPWTRDIVLPSPPEFFS